MSYMEKTRAIFDTLSTSPRHSFSRALSKIILLFEIKVMIRF